MIIALVYHKRSLRVVEEECEYDSDVVAYDIRSALPKHDVRLVRLHRPDSFEYLISRIREEKADLVFGLTAGTLGTSRNREALYAACYEMLNLPYVGSDARTLAITQDKTLTCDVLHARGILTPRGVFSEKFAGVVSRLPRSVSKYVVKPNFEGSSAGVFCVRASDLNRRLPGLFRRKAFRFGARIEEFIPGFDVTVPWTEATGALHPVVPSRLRTRSPLSFYTYRDKAFDIDKNTYLPWNNPTVCDLARERTEHICRVLSVRDVARVDYRFDPQTQTLVCLEVNAICNLGLTHFNNRTESAFPAAAKADGKTYASVISGIVTTARRRDRAAT